MTYLHDLHGVILEFWSGCGTQEPYLSRSPAWPVIEGAETKDRRSIAHRIQAAIDPVRPKLPVRYSPWQFAHQPQRGDLGIGQRADLAIKLPMR